MLPDTAFRFCTAAYGIRRTICSVIIIFHVVYFEVLHLFCPLPEISKCRNAIKATKGGIFADTLYDNGNE